LLLGADLDFNDFQPGFGVRNGLIGGRSQAQKIEVNGNLPMMRQLVDLKKNEIVEGLIIRDMSRQFNQ
jgi:hypothetical protein